MDDIYRQYILEHYREPHNHGTLDQPDIHAADTNPLCGDRVAIDLKVQDGRVSEVSFNGRGCAISQASASMLTDRIEGATVDELKAITPQDVLEMLGVEIGPARQRCALLSLRVLHQGIGGPYTGRMDDDLEDDGDGTSAARGLAERDRTGLWWAKTDERRTAMLSDYMDKAMRHAEYRWLEDGTIFGSIPGFRGVWANANSESACATELREVLKGWLLLGTANHDPLPEVDGMKLEFGKAGNLVWVPIAGGKHEFMERAATRVRIPHLHHGDISTPLLKELLAQAEMARAPHNSIILHIAQAWDWWA